MEHMMIRLAPWRALRAGLALALWIGASATAADAQTRRAERWQFSIPITFTFSQSIGGEGGSFVDLNNDVGWGFAFGYNINQRFYVGGEATWIRASYDATITVDDDGDENSDDTTILGGTLDASSFQAVGQFNFLEESMLTPFVRANLGFTYTDSNIASGPPQGSCWWHPWLGYICDRWIPTYDRTSFSFGGGAGIRADVSRSFFLELSFNGLWIDFAEETPFFDGIRLNVGWLF
jgi:opacity protein-like surface antigen